MESLDHLSWAEAETLFCGCVGATEHLGAIGDTYKARFETLVIEFKKV